MSKPRCQNEVERQNNRDGAAMSFDEIGKELGITRGGAWMAYQRAIRKLRRIGNRQKLHMMRDLAASKGRDV